jgi:hypothetical protein
MPLQATSGAASYDAFGGGTVAKVNYIEDFFQSYLRTGTGASATVTTGLDGSTKETLVWTKSRSAATAHKLTDNVRGATKALSSNTTSAEATDSQGLTAFSATGYTIGTNTDYNNSGATYVDWQWVSQPKFFDVVTWVGTGWVRTLTHNLGSTPGSIFVKKIVGAPQSWAVYHRSLGATQGLALDLPNVAQTWSGYWNNTEPTSTQFTVGGGFNAVDVDYPGTAYVAYLFAHDAGGFGLTGTDNVISCGTYTGSGGVDTITLGYEPQWVLLKGSSTSSPWILMDVMREMSNTDNRYLTPNTSDAEGSYGFAYVRPTSTGFTVQPGYYGTGASVIYIAIRRGLMKVPTSGTSVFEPTAFTSQAGNDTVSSGSVSVVDWGFVKKRTSAELWIAGDRLRGGSYLSFDTTSAEASNVFQWDKQNAFVTNVDDTPSSFIGYSFRRAPSFFDEVCYTGTNVNNQAFTHNLGAVPELMIIKMRVFSSGTGFWFVYSSTLGYTNYLLLNSTDASASAGIFGSQNPDSSSFYVSGGANINSTASQYVAYLFATCAGVSKVFSYTGNGSSQTINCGFTGGARWILIKRTDSTGDWYCWDSARGIVSGNDPHLSLNTTAAEVTSDDTIDTDSTGFVVNQVAATNVNVSSATYIGLAIA